jgi:hypothetical protein
MAYTTDLITVFKSLFDVEQPISSERTMWSELNRVFQAYERLDDPRQQIHRRICANFRLDRQIDVDGIRHELRELLEGEPLLPARRNETGRGGPSTSRVEPASSPHGGRRATSRGERGEPATSELHQEFGKVLMRQRGARDRYEIVSPYDHYALL